MDSPDFQPLATCPPDRRQKYAKRAHLAEDSYRAAVELKCLECCAWDRSEAKRCEITACPLWKISRRIFGDRGVDAASESPRAAEAAEEAAA